MLRAERAIAGARGNGAIRRPHEHEREIAAVTFPFDALHVPFLSIRGGRSVAAASPAAAPAIAAAATVAAVAEPIGAAIEARAGKISSAMDDTFLRRRFLGAPRG